MKPLAAVMVVSNTVAKTIYNKMLACVLNTLNPLLNSAEFKIFSIHRILYNLYRVINKDFC